MWNWISQNKQWLFSGVGVSAVLVVCGFLYRSFAGRKSAPSSLRLSPALNSQIPSVASPLTRPTPVEIKKYISTLPPFQQVGAAESYIGLKVCWKARFQNLWQLSSEKQVWNVLLHQYESEYIFESIICNGVNLDICPRLKIAHANEDVLVRGTIDGVSTYVSLIDATIEFL